MSPKYPELAHYIQSTLYNINLSILVRGKREWIFNELHRQSGFLLDLTLCLCFNELLSIALTQRKRRHSMVQKPTVPYVWSRKSSME